MLSGVPRSHANDLGHGPSAGGLRARRPWHTVTSPKTLFTPGFTSLPACYDSVENAAASLIHGQQNQCLL
jgi:hypothetical protein